MAENKVNGFDQLLRELDAGAVNERADQRLRELVKGVAATGKKGTLTLKLEVAAHANAITVKPSVDAKVPQAALEDVMYFPDEEGGLHRSNPKQQELPLRSVPGVAGATMDIRVVKKN